MGRIYRPNMTAFLSVALDSDDPAAADVVTFETRIKRASWTSNDHNHADELEIEGEWNDTGIDPRILSSGTVEFHLGDSEEGGFWESARNNLRFIGRIVECERSASEDGARVQIRAQDYTSFLLAAKPVATASIPLITDTLVDAWARLCSDPRVGMTELKDRIRFLGLPSPGPVLAKAVAPRFAKIGGRIPVKPGTDAWAIWQQACGMVGLISWIDLDEVVVSTATDYYTGDDPPRLLWGQSIAEMTERRSANRDQKGVMIQSYDPLSGKTLEATYDPLAGNVVKGRKGRAGAHRAGKPAAAPKGTAPPLEPFQFSGITEQAALDDLARRVYEERSRQALEGTIRTAEMSLPTVSGAEMDLLTLRSGDTIDVRFADTSALSFAATFPSATARAKYLETVHGYQAPVALLIANTLQRMGTSPSLMYVKTVKTSLTIDKDGGSFSVEIGYCNKIDPRGGTEA